MTTATGSSPQTRHVPQEDRADTAYRLLQHEIVEMKRPPGEQLSEVAIAEHLGMSRTPVREALRRLSDKGLVVLEPGRPATVAPITPGTIAQTHQVREALETYAFRLAALSPEHARFRALADRMDSLTQSDQRDLPSMFDLVDEIMTMVETVTGNTMLINLIAGLRLQMRRMYGLNPDRQARISIAVTQWAELLAAVTRGDPVEAARLVSIRLQGSMQTITDAFPRLPQHLIGPIDSHI